MRTTEIAWAIGLMFFTTLPLHADGPAATNYDDLIEHAWVIGLGTLSLGKPEAEGKRHGSLTFKECLYSTESGRVMRTTLVVNPADRRGRPLPWVDGQLGIWFVQRDDQRSSINDPSVFRPAEERDAVVAALKRWLEKSIDVDAAALRARVKADPGGDQPETIRAAEKLHRLIDNRRTLPGQDDIANSANFARHIQMMFEIYGVKLNYPTDPQTDQEWAEVIDLAMHFPDYRARFSGPVAQPAERWRRPLAMAVVNEMHRGFLRTTVMANDVVFRAEFKQRSRDKSSAPSPLPTRARELAELKKNFESGKLNNL